MISNNRTFNIYMISNNRTFNIYMISNSRTFNIYMISNSRTFNIYMISNSSTFNSEFICLRVLHLWEIVQCVYFLLYYASVNKNNAIFISQSGFVQTSFNNFSGSNVQNTLFFRNFLLENIIFFRSKGLKYIVFQDHFFTLHTCNISKNNP